MVDQNTPDILTFNFDVDAKDAIKKIGRFQQALNKRVQDSEKAIKKMDKGFFKFVKQVKSVGPQSKGITQMTQHMKELDQYVTKTVPQLQALADAAAKAGDTEMLADLDKKVKELQNTYKEMARGHESIEKDSIDVKGLIDAAQEAGEELTAPLHELLSRDAPALFKRATNIVAKSLDKTLGKAGGKLGAWAGGKAAHHKASGGNKMMGGMFKSLELVGKAFASLGPLIQITSAFMASFVKIMIDAEAAAKDYNKQILASSGTSEFLHRNMGNVAAGAADLDKSLKAARDGAMGFDGVMKAIDTSKWGINKETAAAFQSGLAAEGVSLGKLGDALERSTGYAKDHATAIQMSVAYSRAFGVSLSELTQLQGSMMADMGASIDTVQTSFQMMANAAADSGMATNKFFGIIRGFSSDLSLFTLRMEELTKVMKTLGKTMDPREAQKFLQSVTQKFSGGLADNLKHVIISGPESGTRAKEDLADKLGGLMEDLANTLGKNSAGTTNAIKELQGIIADPKRDPRAIQQWAAKQPVKIEGGVMSSLLDAANMQTKLASGNQIDLASVADQLSPLAKMDITQSEIRKLTGKGFDQLSGIDLLAVEQAGLASAQEIRMYQKFNQGIIGAQEELIARIAKGNASQEDIAKLTKMGVTYNKDNPKEMAEQLRSKFDQDKGNRKFWATLTEDQKKLLGDSAAEIDYQKETSTFQVSALDRLQQVADVLLNQIYNILVSIWESITDAFGRLFGGKEAEVRSAQAAAGRSRDADLIKAVTEAKTPAEIKRNVVEDVGKPLMEQAQAAAAELKQIRSTAPENEADAKKRAARAKELEPLAKFGEYTHDNIYKQDMNAKELLELFADMKKAAAGLKVKSEPLKPKAATPVEPPKPDIADSLPMVNDPNRMPNAEGLPTAEPLPAMAMGPFPPSALIGGKPDYPTSPTVVTPVPGTGSGAAAASKDTVNVVLTVDKNLDRFVHAKVVNGVASFERNKRLR